MTNKALSRQNKTGKFVPCCAENSVPEAAGAEATSHTVFLLNRVHTIKSFPYQFTILSKGCDQNCLKFKL